MYVYLEPQGGFNDIMVLINIVLDYCNKYNRILLINGLKSDYRTDFSDYFEFSNHHNVICDTSEIIKICSNVTSIYPDVLKNKMTNILNGECFFSFSLPEFTCVYNGVMLDLPEMHREEKIIVYARCGHAFDGYKIFRQLKMAVNIKNLCKKRYGLLKKPYLSIHVRNTDYKSDYESLYYNNRELIHSFNEIYLATDDRNVIDFFRSKRLPIKNFTTFPNGNYYNLHYSEISPYTKMVDLFCDIFIISMSNKLLSNSTGGFTGLVKTCKENAYEMFYQFQ
jgi:hypothetical protein